MMRCATLLIGLLSTLSGCTHVALRNDTVQTSSTLADLQFQQVLNNVARFHNNPDTVPSFAVITAGTVSVSDEASAGLSPTYAPTLTFAQQGGGPVILQILFPFAGERSVTENWTLTPVTDADNLRRLRCAYRLLVMGESTPDYEFCMNQMQEFFAGQMTTLGAPYPPQGWYGVGGKKDIPKDACYVGCHGHTHVWVMPEGMNGLALFTLGTLDLATGEPHHVPQRTVVSTYKGEPKPENLVQTTVTRTEDDEAALEAIRKGQTQRPDRSRMTDSPQLNHGLFLLR